MGFFTFQVQVVSPSPADLLSTILPLPTATSVSGTVMLREAPLSGSSLWWSLQGYHTLAPRPWQATLIQGLSCASFFQIQPPSHGGLVASRGFPEKEIWSCAILPAAGELSIAT